MPLDKERWARSDVKQRVSYILALRSKRLVRQKLAMQFSRDLVKAIVARDCTDPEFASRQLFKLWRKLGFLP